MKRVYEFLVWDNCNNNCQFCWQRENPRIYNVKKRQEILNEVLNFINSDKFVKGSHILVCGGEIFDDVIPYNYLNEFFYTISCLMYNDVIELLYLNTNLLCYNIEKVVEILELFEEKSLIDRIRFTTSYDIVGRFKDEESRERMMNNLARIKLRFYNLPTVINTVLTKQACEAILEGSYNLKETMKLYNCWINLVPYIVLDEKLQADKSLIFKTLYYINQENEGYLEKYVPNMCITQEKWLYMYKDNEFQFCSCPVSEDCGHSVNFKRYSKEGTCFCCDLQEVFGEYV